MTFKFDPTKIKGPYQLLTIFIIAMESVLSLWITLSDNSEERIAIGAFMTIIAIAFLIVIVVIKRSDTSKEVILPGTDEKISPAQKEVTQDEIESPDPQQIADPYRRYVIDKPPENWIIKQMDFDDWKYETLGITDKKIKEKLNQTGLDEDIFILSSNKSYKLLPKPGMTKVNGRLFHSALELTLKVEVGIVSLSRFDPPYYVKKDFENNTLDAAGGFSAAGLSFLKNNLSGTIQKSNRRYRLFEFHQELENVLVNEQETQRVTSIIILMGIEGETRDHLLFIKYPLIEPSLQLEGEIKNLYDIVNSFQPLKSIDPKLEFDKIEQQVKKEYAETWEKYGKEHFENEITIFLLRLADQNLDSVENMSKTIKGLNNFKKFALGLKIDSDYNILWEVLDKAEKGNLEPLKIEIKNWIKEFKKQQKE